MSINTYLKGILEQQAVSYGDPIHNKLTRHREEIEGILRKNYGYKPRIYYGGSWGKRTMIKLAYDLDIVIYFPPTETMNLRDIYNSVYSNLVNSGYRVYKKTVAIRIQYQDFHIDVVPGQARDEDYYEATLYKNGEDTTMQTSLKKHIDSVREIRDTVKLMKIWRVQHSVPIETFPLEQIIAEALKWKSKNDYENCILSVLELLKNEILTIKVVDPAVPSNEVEISPHDRYQIKAIAENCLTNSWQYVIY